LIGRVNKRANSIFKSLDKKLHTLPDKQKNTPILINCSLSMIMLYLKECLLQKLLTMGFCAPKLVFEHEERCFAEAPFEKQNNGRKIRGSFMARFSLVRAMTLQSTHLSVQSTRKIHSLCIMFNMMYFLVRYLWSFTRLGTLQLNQRFLN
jgi:hypothetical protein